MARTVLARTNRARLLAVRRGAVAFTCREKAKTTCPRAALANGMYRQSLAWSARDVPHGTRAAAIGEGALQAGEERRLGLDGKKLGVCARGKHASSVFFLRSGARAGEAREPASERAYGRSKRRRGAYRGPAPFGTVAAGVPRIGLVRFWGDGTREIATWTGRASKSYL